MIDPRQLYRSRPSRAAAPSFSPSKLPRRQSKSSLHSRNAATLKSKTRSKLQFLSIEKAPVATDQGGEDLPQLIQSYLPIRMLPPPPGRQAAGETKLETTLLTKLESCQNPSLKLQAGRGSDAGHVLAVAGSQSTLLRRTEMASTSGA